MRRGVVVAVAAAVVVLVGAAATVGVLVLRDDGPSAAQIQVLGRDGEFDHDYLIPAGTQARIRAGEVVEIVPRRLAVTVGESIRIRNEDTAGAFVGIFFVGPGETVRMRFTTPGELTGACDVHPSGEFTIDIDEVDRSGASPP